MPRAAGSSSGLRDSPLRSERWLRHVPVVLIEYPLEVLLAAWGVLSGVPLLLGIAAPTSVTSLLPPAAVLAWAGCLTVSGVTIAVGLLRGRFGTAVARGLQLLGTSCAVWALTILATVGWRQGIPAGPLLTAIAALCYLRGWYLRLRRRLGHRLERERAATEREILARERRA